MCEEGGKASGRADEQASGEGRRRGSATATLPSSQRRSTVLRSVAVSVFIVHSGVAILPSLPALHAQDDTTLEGSRRRLEEIRRERDRLEEQQQRLQGQVHDVNDELTNLERQRESTQRIVSEIERQIGGLASQLDRSSAELILAEDNLAERRAVLERRLVDIYKRGQLYTFQALFAAESFGDLLSRYKYLYLTSRQDRALVADVEQLRNRVVVERNTILNVRTQLDRSRAGARGRVRQVHRPGPGARPAAGEPAALRAQHRAAADARCRRTRPGSTACSRRSSGRGARRPRAASLRGAVTGPGSITTASLGKLDWPVEGTIVYRFGRDTLPSGGIIRWNGVGIAAAVGHAGARGGGGQGAAGGTVRDLRAHDRAGARQRLLLGVLPPAIGGREARGDDHQGHDRSGPSAARTPTTAPTCTSRSGARTRSRSIRRPGCGSGSRGVSRRRRSARRSAPARAGARPRPERTGRPAR